MVTPKSRTFTPNAYTRPDVVMKPRPSIEPRPTMGAAYAKLVCTSTPSGAKVTLSSQTMRYASELGVTPVTTTVREGTYTLRFTKGGYKPVNKSVMLKPGETRTVNVTLPLPYVIIPIPPPPEKAKLICNSTPQGAEVTVSATGISAYLGGTTPCTLMLEPNVVYTLTFKKPGLKPTYKKYTLKAGETRTVNVTLPLPYVPIPIPPPPPPPPVPPAPAKIICDTTPSGAEVTVAATGISAYLGGTTPVTLTLKPNVMYTLTFKKPGLEPTYRKYSLKPGEVREINVALPLPYVPVPPPVPPPSPPAPPEQAKLICKSTPSGASVTLYSETMRHAIDAGVTPVTVPLKEGVYTVVFTKGGYQTVREEGVVLKPGEMRAINVTLPLPYVPPPPTPPPTPPPEIPKIDVISFTTAPSCVIGDICKGEVVLQNNTDAALEGAINITMEGAVPVVPVTYSIPSHAKETVSFEIPTVGLTITGAYTLELDMLMNDEIVESQRSRVEIEPPPDYDVTFTSDPSTAKVVVTEV